MRANADWFRDAGWGVFTHYLGGRDMPAEDWNKRVDDFDVKGLAGQLASIGTRYYFITIGQNSGHYCSPNSTYDSFVGIQPSKCSERDLISDLHDALHPNGIKLMVYLPSGAPAADPIAVQKLGWEWGFKGRDWPGSGTEKTGKRLAEFQTKWEAVIREWSLRWGKKVCGWWVDGCYFADEMYRHPEPPNFRSFAAALKAGNPDSLVAFNPGVRTPVISLTAYEDYTAGEIMKGFPVCPGPWYGDSLPRPGRWVDGAQYHVLCYLGEYWGKGVPRFPDEFVVGYTKLVMAHEGVVTWDVPIEEAGLIAQPFVNQLTALSRGLVVGTQRCQPNARDLIGAPSSCKHRT